jgi:hypothetical protein
LSYNILVTANSLPDRGALIIKIMKSLDRKIIVYDSNCKVCSSLKDVVLRFTAVPGSKVVAFKDLDHTLVKHVDPEKFRNVMALIDLHSGETLYGAHGVSYIFSSQYRVADILLGFKPFFALFAFLYKTQAYNRYIIATPKSNFSCDCFPDRVIKYRLSYIGISILISMVLLIFFGSSLHQSSADPAMIHPAVFIASVVATALLFQVILAAIALRSIALDYIGHLSSMLVAGALVLFPFILWNVFAVNTFTWITVSGLIISFGTMLYLLSARVRYLGLSHAWTFSWFASIVGSVSVMNWFFPLI